MGQMKIAILDDFRMLRWVSLTGQRVSRRADITVFNDHVANPALVVQRLQPFDIVCLMRRGCRCLE